MKKTAIQKVSPNSLSQFRGPSRAWRQLAILAAAAFVAGSGLVPLPYQQLARADDGTWNVNADGNWSAAGSWDAGTIPGTTSGTTSTDTAYFSTLLTAARTVTVDTSRNIRNIIFGEGNSSNFGYALSGGSLLLTSGGTLQTIGTGTHTETIASPMTIIGNNGSYTFANDSDTRLLNIAGSITGQSTVGGTTRRLGRVRADP